MNTLTAAVAGPPANTPEWLEARYSCIGASEAAAALGLSPWQTTRELYHRKRRELPDEPDNAAMRLGRALEPVVVDQYHHATGATIEAHPCQLFKSKRWPWMGATPDALVVDQANPELFPLEAKTTSWRRAEEWGPEGSDEIPVDYLCQAQQQMLVLGRDRCDLAVLIDGRTLRTYTARRSDRLCAALVEAEWDLWDRIQTGRPPDHDWEHSQTPDLVRDLYGLDAAQTITMGPELVALWANYRDARDVAAEWNTKADTFKARVLDAMGPAAVARFPRGTRELVRARRSRKEYTVKESSYITLTERAAKR
jgi:putative phage-type endonuclease